MCYRPLLHLQDESAYRTYYLQTLCRAGSITMCDGMRVRFFPEAFDHAFYQNTDRRGCPITPIFCMDRAERMAWMPECLRDGALPNYRRVMPNGEIRRLVLVPSERYLVVLRAVRGMTCKFLTAYVVNSQSALRNIQANPLWW